MDWWACSDVEGMRQDASLPSRFPVLSRPIKRGILLAHSCVSPVSILLLCVFFSFIEKNDEAQASMTSMAYPFHSSRYGTR